MSLLVLALLAFAGSSSPAVCDKNYPEQCASVDSTGAIKVTGISGNGGSSSSVVSVDGGTVSVAGVVQTQDADAGSLLAQVLAGQTSGGQKAQVTNFPASQPVTGTFWQSTQPVSIASMPSTPVTGTFWPTVQPVQDYDAGVTLARILTSLDGGINVLNFPATQPVSGSVSVSNFPATQAVSGTFWQATQPVSIASMPSTPVTGTFWQTTQPVSGTFWQATQPVSIASMPSTPVTGTFWQTTQPVSIASMPSTPVTGVTAAPAANPTVQSSGVALAPAVDETGNVYVIQGGPHPFNCSLTAVGTSATQCQAAPGTGLRLYVTDIVAYSVTAASTIKFQSGTGSNCATNNAAVGPTFTVTSPLSTGAPAFYSFKSPIIVPTVSAICAVCGSGTDTCDVFLTGYIAP